MEFNGGMGATYEYNSAMGGAEFTGAWRQTSSKVCVGMEKYTQDKVKSDEKRKNFISKCKITGSSEEKTCIFRLRV